ncbi:tyrosine-type recombinase/integrase [Thermosulfurimonas marina]|uniref:Tyrosine-type recombinase/integrase n=1 Tax=Thermosulfurimonas marina TaxID=2047767 RepID=A0A6H1WRY2_9BACT|nr:tyrosine-type recombinase/integrase [Thermosulfurimonas marina]
MDVREIRAFHLEDLLQRLRENPGKRGRALQKIFVELRAFLNWCRKREIIDRVPALPEIKVPESPIRFLTPHEQALVLEAIPEEHRPIFTFLFATGCRVGEVRALMWDCVYLSEGFLLIRRTFSGDYLREIPKEGKQKAIPLVSVIRDVIEHQARNKKAVWVFPYRHPRRKDYYTAYPTSACSPSLRKPARKWEYRASPSTRPPATLSPCNACNRASLTKKWGPPWDTVRLKPPDATPAYGPNRSKASSKGPGSSPFQKPKSIWNNRRKSETVLRTPTLLRRNCNTILTILQEVMNQVPQERYRKGISITE